LPLGAVAAQPWFVVKDVDFDHRLVYGRADGISSFLFFQIDRNGPFDAFPPFSMPFSVVSKETFGDFSALRALKLKLPVEHDLLPAPDKLPSLVTLSFTCMTTPASPRY
jgi:hypothetical protein